ncbi:rplU [Symbiodinium necroappetens]|uniref:Large ribosomal subunit protein bL21m n=1 Tax=Symbiodinium necroappetens TaxID=1628268 RepID=A0A813CIF7_9DINO|nr:rplU [Symbiodinium necroappetens]
MYAIIEDSGTQIKASEGDVLTLDIRELPDDAKTVTFDRVLLIGGDGKSTIGQPYVDGASVTAEIIDREFKGEKIDVIKFKRRKGYKVKQGHRQRYMKVKVSSITG